MFWRAPVAGSEPTTGEPPEIATLRLANDFLAQEVLTGVPTDNLFGGAFEVMVRGEDLFSGVDDVVHVFASVRVSKDRPPEV